MSGRAGFPSDAVTVRAQLRPVGGLLASVLRRDRVRLLRFGGWSLVAAVPTFLSGLLLARAIDDGFLAGRPGTGLAWLGALVVAVAVGTLGTRRTYDRLAELVEPFRDDLVELGVAGTLRRSAAPGAVPDTAGVARTTRQVEVVREAFGSLLMVVESVVASAAAALFGLAALAPELVALVAPPLLVGVAVFVAALAPMARRQATMVLVEEEIAACSTRLTAALRDVVACGAEPQARATVGLSIDAHARAAAGLARFTALRTLALGIGGWLPVVAVLVAAPWLLDRGLTTGELLGGVLYVVNGVQPALQQLARVVGGSALPLAVTLGRLLDASVPPHPAAVGRSAPGDDLALHGIRVGYGRHADPVLSDVDLAVPSGEHLVVVGASGAGKSTLAALLTGMLEPDGGSVTLGGLALRDWDRTELIRRRVLIPQEAYVFAGTVRENVVYLNPDADPGELDAAVRAVGMAGLVRRLGGYDAEMSPASLSAGERQLVALARAYLSPARLVVLDEATCHLDPRTEARAEAAFASRGGTLVVVAHRISSALRADRVALVDAGTLLAGTHAELLARSALYRDLVGYWDGEAPR